MGSPTLGSRLLCSPPTWCRTSSRSRTSPSCTPSREEPCPPRSLGPRPRLRSPSAGLSGSDHSSDHAPIALSPSHPAASPLLSTSPLGRRAASRRISPSWTCFQRSSPCETPTWCPRAPSGTPSRASHFWHRQARAFDLSETSWDLMVLIPNARTARLLPLYPANPAASPPSPSAPLHTTSR